MNNIFNKTQLCELSWKEGRSIYIGLTPEVRPRFCDRLLSGVKQTVSAYILVLDDSLQRANSGHSEHQHEGY